MLPRTSTSPKPTLSIKPNPWSSSYRQPITDFLLRTIQNNGNDQELETIDASSEHSADY
ncbi:hypothetical protein AMTR_s00125p00101460, partial [Amborella trichopoda]